MSAADARRLAIGILPYLIAATAVTKAAADVPLPPPPPPPSGAREIPLRPPGASPKPPPAAPKAPPPPPQPAAPPSAPPAPPRERRPSPPTEVRPKPPEARPSEAPTTLPEAPEAAQPGLPAPPPPPSPTPGPAAHTAVARPPPLLPVVADHRVAPSRSPGVHEHDNVFIRLSLGVAALSSRGSYVNGVASSDSSLGSGTTPQPSSRRVLGGMGLAADAALGGVIKNQVLVACQIASYMFSDADLQGAGTSSSYSLHLDVKYLSFGVLGAFFPSPHSGAHIGLGVGALGERGSGAARPVGLLIAPEAGFAGWVGEQWSLGVVLRVAMARLTGNNSQYAVATSEIANVTIGSLSLALDFD